MTGEITLMGHQHRFISITSLPLPIAQCCLAITAFACMVASPACRRAAPAATQIRLTCDPQNGGLTTAPDLCLSIAADLDEAGLLRHAVVTAWGDLLVTALPWRKKPGGLFALRDSDGDGVFDIKEPVVEGSFSDVAIRGEYVYLAATDSVVRYRLEAGELRPAGTPEIVVSNLPADGEHATKEIVFDATGRLFVAIGSATNQCQAKNRAVEAPGLDPCPERATRAGVWVFDSEQPSQTQGKPWVSGVRNLLAIAPHPETGQLLGVQHGRDDLSRDWPKLFSALDGATKPAEEFLILSEGQDFGWPYCYYDPVLGARVLSPEYGGDGKSTQRCAHITPPMMTFPAHWAPNDLLFYTGELFPEKYRGGAFIAFHGPDVRTEHAPDGFRVVFVPFSGERPSGAYETVVDGFAGGATGRPQFRPMGLAQGNAGVIVLENERGRIWRLFPRAASGSTTSTR